MKLYLGLMASGKTAQLIENLKKNKKVFKHYVAVCPQSLHRKYLDENTTNQDPSNLIVSRNGKSANIDFVIMECEELIKTCFSILRDKSVQNIIHVDDAFLLSVGQVREIYNLECSFTNVEFALYTIKADYNRTMFPSVVEMVRLSSNIIPLHGPKCVVCNEAEATADYKTSKSIEDVDTINAKYIPLCEHCFESDS